MKSPDIKGRTAIVTGGNRGLGKAIAKAYLEAGANVVLCARSEELLAETARELGKLQGGKVLWRRADVSRDEDVVKVIEDTLNEFGHFEILINNAGVYGPKGAIDDVAWDEWLEALLINIAGSV